MMAPLLDRFARPLGNLRVSVTDRCNLRCEYCMPEADYVWLPREDVLHFEEIGTLVNLFIRLGVNKVRLTGGEPLLRRDLPELVRMLAAKPGLTDLALTTNGVLLAEQAEALKTAGLGRITVSLDTLHADRFERLTRFNELARVQEGLAAAARVFAPAAANLIPRFKIDSVVIRGVNDDELVDLVEYGKSLGAEVRFIEYMDVGGATRWSSERVVSRQEMLAELSRRYGRIEALVKEDSAPADRFALPDGTVIGIISSTTDPFCRDCDRSRLTADGMWYMCLYAAEGLDLRGALRRGAPPAEIEALIADAWRKRVDRGAEDRLAVGGRHAFVPIATLRRDPHLEMHTRGG
jgi:cyclic pyranopterin phosphate synthase